MQFLLHHYSIWSNHSLGRRVLRIPCLCLIGRALSIGIQPENPVKRKERNVVYQRLVQRTHAFVPFPY